MTSGLLSKINTFKWAFTGELVYIYILEIQAMPLEPELLSWKRSSENNFMQTITGKVLLQCVHYECWMYY